jgi:hypothetical protein
MASGTKGRGHLRASDADREQLIDTLKEAFALGQLTRDELVARTAGRSRRGPAQSWPRLPPMSLRC